MYKLLSMYNIVIKKWLYMYVINVIIQQHINKIY
jgi:hypothetical protein